MDSSRTRFLLRAMRPNGADHADPVFREALEQTHADPELRAWFERERAVDRALAARLHEFRAPADLRAQILQGLALSPALPAVDLRRPLMLFAAGLAAAASIALVVYTALPVSRRPLASFDLIVTAAVRDTAQPPTLALTTDSGAEIRTWLESSGAPIPGALPGELPRQEIVGCALVEWEGARCSLVTMRAPELRAEATASDPTLVHLYTVPRSSCSTQGVSATPLIALRDAATVATWRDVEHYYVLVTRASPASVQLLLGADARIAQADEAQPVRLIAMVVR